MLYRVIIQSVLMLCILKNQSNAISIDEYIVQVENSNKDYAGYSLSSKGYLLQSDEAFLQYSSQLFFNAQRADDRRSTISSSFQGTQTVQNILSTGISKLTTFGLQGKLYYAVNNTNILGVNASFVNLPRYYNNTFGLELTQKLWGDGFGRATKASANAEKLRILSLSHNQKFQSKITILEAKKIFWQFASLERIIAIQRESLNSAVKTQKLNAHKVGLGLMEKSDLTQAETVVQTRKSELEAYILEHDLTRKQFNLTRGMSDDSDVYGEISLPDVDYVLSLELPETTHKREDVKSAEANYKSMVEKYEATKHRQRPQMDLFVNATSNGRNQFLNQAWQNTMSTDYPYVTAGVNFNIPLDQTLVSQVKSSYKMQAEGAKFLYDQVESRQKTALNSIIDKFQNSKDRLRIALEITKLQQLKLEQEKLKYQLGKTTATQVFDFEHNLLLSRIDQVKLVTQILNLFAEIETYKQENEHS